MKAKRPLEIVSVFQVEMSTKDGDSYIYCALDSFSEFLFQTGIERNRSHDNIIKHTKLLMAHTDFKNGLNRCKSFKLVFHKFEEIAPEINAIINPLGGTMVVDHVFVNREFAQVIKKLYTSFKSKRK